MTRTEFLRGGLAVLGGGLVLHGCSGNDGGGDIGGGECDSVSVDIQTNHADPHTITIPGADILAGNSQTYPLTPGDDGHTHTITVNVPNMEKLAMGESIQVLTTTEGEHQHFVTLTC